MMENTAIILIVITLFLLVIIVGLLTLLVLKMMKQTPTVISSPPSLATTGEAPHPDVSKAEFHPAIMERMKELEKVKPRKAELFCPNHSDEPGEVTCAVCDKLYCKACIKPYKTMHFCKEHLPLIMRYDWDEVLTVKTSTADPEEGVRLYDVKKDLFEKEDIPTYIETHYKINVDQDYIETYLVMFAIKEKVADLKKRLESFIIEH
jgi:hypothetical protein